MPAVYNMAFANGVLALVDTGTGNVSVADDAPNILAAEASQIDIAQTVVVFRAMDMLWREIVTANGAYGSIGTDTDTRVDSAIARAKARATS